MTDSERAWIETHFRDLSEEVTKLRIAVATLKVKNGMLSIFFGTLGGFLAIAVSFLRRGL